MNDYGVSKFNWLWKVLLIISKRTYVSTVATSVSMKRMPLGLASNRSYSVDFASRGSTFGIRRNVQLPFGDKALSKIGVKSSKDGSNHVVGFFPFFNILLVWKVQMLIWRQY